MAELVATETFKGGLDSVTNPCDLPPGFYQFARNIINKGGTISTRPGQVTIETAVKQFLHYPPRGLKMFTPRDGMPELVVATSEGIYHLRYPFSGNWQQIGYGPGTPLTVHPTNKVEMEVAVVGVTQDSDGNVTACDPYPVLMIADGATRTAFWDGVVARYLDPDPDGAHETPVCQWMRWIGNRLWTAQGRKIRVSNLLNPVKFTEEDILSEGGYFNLPDNCTGFGATPDFRSLLAFSDFTTTSFQAGIINRATWNSTQDFQKVLFSNIGCAAGRSIVNQYGMTWWYSHNGLISLDSALQTYRSSEIKFKDAAMRRSRANFSRDISNICAAAYENYLLVSVPSGDSHNYHTWVMDQNPNEMADMQAQWSSVWTGIRPVQYATGVVDGNPRCFAISDDYPAAVDTTTITSTNIWELFLSDRRDIGSGGVAAPLLAKNIPCGFETRLIFTQQPCAIKYIELDLEEIAGTVQLEIYYATRRGAYKRFGTKQIVGTVSSVNAALPATFESRMPQRRTVKSVNECVLSTDSNPSVETPQIKSIDKYFSFLIKWTGQMAVTRMRVYVDPVPEHAEGASEENETTDRYIRPDGTGAILTTGPSTLPITSQCSTLLPANSPRWAEEIYQSLT